MKEGLVPFNVAARATLPKAEHKDVNYFQPEQVTAIREALGRELAGEETRLAGEDFGKICRYLAVSLLRDRLGLFLEGEEESRVLERRWGYDFSQGELAGLREQFSAAAAFCPGEAGSAGLEAESKPGAESETGAEPESGAEERAAAGRSTTLKP